MGECVVGSCGVKFFDSENFHLLTPIPTPKTPRFFSLGMSDLSYILVLKCEDAHMDKKANE